MFPSYMCLHFQRVYHQTWETVATFQNCLCGDTPFDLYYYHIRRAVFEWCGDIFTLDYVALLFTLFGSEAYSMLSN